MEVKKIKQKYQSRPVEEKVKSELLWDEGKQGLGQDARGWERGGNGLRLRDTGRSLLL